MASRRLWIAAVFLFVLGDAVALQTRGALLPSFGSAFDVSPGLLGLVAPAGTVGFVAAVLAVGVAAGRLDVRGALLVGVAVTGVSLLFASAAPTYPLLLLFIAAQGTATGVVRALDRPILGHLYPSRRGRVFALHALAWAVGAVAGPLLVNAVLARGDWRLTYVVLGGFFLPLALLLWRLELPGGVREERALSWDAVAGLLRRPAVVAVAASMALSGAIEGIVFTWLPYYAAAFTTHELANLLLSVYLVAYLPGRLAYSVVVDRVGAPNLMVVLGAGTLPALAVVFSGVSGPALFGAALVAGFFLSGFFPIVSAYGVNAAPEFSGPVNAVAVAGTYGGIAVGPVAVGLLAERTDIGTAMGVPVALAVVLLAVLLLTRATVGRTDAT